MRFFAVLLLTILTAYTSKLQAQQYQKRFGLWNSDTTYTGFTPLRDSGIAIITVANKLNSEIKVVKIDKNGSQAARVKLTLPMDFNCETYTPVIIEDEEGALICSFSYSGTFNLNGVIIFKLSPSLTVLWNKYVLGAPMKQFAPMTRCGKKYFTVSRQIKNDPSGLNPKLEFGYTLSCFDNNGDHVWSKTFLSDSSNYYENLSVFTNNRNSVVVTSAHGTIQGLNENTHRFVVYNEVDTNGTVLQTKAATGITPVNLSPYGTNQYLFTGYTDRYPVVGILNSNLQSTWARAIKVNDNRCMGMAYEHNGSIYFHTTHVENQRNMPISFQFDAGGTVLSSYISNSNFCFPFSAKRTVGGKHAIVANMNKPSNNASISICLTDTLSELGVCPSLSSCAAPMQSTSVNGSNFVYREQPSYQVQELNISAQSTSIQLANYCNPVAIPIATFTSPVDTVCAGTTVQFLADSTMIMGTSGWSVSGPVNYSVQATNLIYTFTEAGEYNIFHQNTIAFCTDTFSQTVVVKGQLPSNNAQYCDTVRVSQIIGAACQITWPDGGQGPTYVPPTNNSQGLVSVTCGECSASTLVTFTKLFAPRLNPASFEMCAGGEVTVSYPSAQYVKLEWSDGYIGNTRTLTQPGMYYINVTGQHCSALDSLRVKEIKPDATFALANDTFCVNQPFDLLSLPDLNDQNSTWKITGPEQKSFDAKNVLGLTLTKTGTYTISHKHIIGYCINTYAQKLIIVGTKANTEATTCDTLFAADISTTCAVQWPNGSDAAYYVPSSKSASIPVTVTCNGCTAPYNIHVNWLPHPALPSHSIEICESQNYRYIIPYNYAHTAVWQDGSDALSYAIDTAGVYVVNLTKGACKTTDTLTVTTLDCDGCSVYIPNAFTPNNDEANDIFTTYTNCPFIAQYQLQVYNRYGELVFESLDETKGWNGEYKGNPSPPGVYVYVLQIITKGTKDFESKNYKGSFTLLR
ncbi:MAG: gliding motility-associated C-terminal domain-containing protein [Bacteroidetes bacterium]|nr:gliding motility-associated C-terminal domain-containing protein [Bacteroidota bacterium]